MRVLHVISAIDPVAGGVATALAGLAQAQAREGINVAVVSTWQQAPGNAVADTLRRAGVELQLIGPASGRLSRHPDLSNTLNLMIAGRDVVHIHALWEEIQHQAARTAWRLNVPYIFSPHGMLDPWALHQARLKKRLYMAWRLRRDLNGATAIHFTSQPEQMSAQALALHPRQFVEPLGIDIEEFANLPSRGEFAGRHASLKSKRILLFLSRIHLKKGLDLLIPAFAKAAADGWALVIAGPDDGYLATAKDLVHRHGLEDRTIFPGMLYGRDRLAAFVDADLFALPSYQENFGIVVLESLAAGTPVVVSDQVNICHQIQSGRVGAVVQTQVDQLSNVLQQWMNDEALRRSAAERGPGFVREHYDWHAIARNWQGHYQSILNSRGA